MTNLSLLELVASLGLIGIALALLTQLWQSFCRATKRVLTPRAKRVTFSTSTTSTPTPTPTPAPAPTATPARKRESPKFTNLYSVPVTVRIDDSGVAIAYITNRGDFALLFSSPTVGGNNTVVAPHVVPAFVGIQTTVGFAVELLGLKSEVPDVTSENAFPAREEGVLYYVFGKLSQTKRVKEEEEEEEEELEVSSSYSRSSRSSVSSRSASRTPSPVVVVRDEPIVYGYRSPSGKSLHTTLTCGSLKYSKVIEVNDPHHGLRACSKCQQQLRVHGSSVSVVSSPVSSQ